MIYGYARVSATDQNLDTQINQLRKFGVDKITSEKISGISKERILNDLLKTLNERDTIVATRMDRLGRNARQLLELVEDLSERQINLVILDLNIDTRTPTGKFFLTVMAAFSELERTNLKEKQRKGIEIAKKRGNHLGRPRKFDKDGLEHAVELYKEGTKTVKEICAITKVSRSSFYRHIKSLN